MEKKVEQDGRIKQSNRVVRNESVNWGKEVKYSEE